MKTKDHLVPGCCLLARENTPELRTHCLAFLLGCIEPDYNQFSYLRGIVHHRKFRGHNAENSFAYLSRCRARFDTVGVSTDWDFFRLGAMLHYAADAFTWPHNAFWPGTLAGHVAYEQELHRVFSDYLRQEPEAELFCGDEQALHAAYAAAPHGMETDCRFILAACTAILHRALRCVPVREPAAPFLPRPVQG